MLAGRALRAAAEADALRTAAAALEARASDALGSRPGGLAVYMGPGLPLAFVPGRGSAAAASPAAGAEASA
eukprot:10444957-Alexandrium_andersonii.AAC.1